jgi:hypothetical protein
MNEVLSIEILGIRLDEPVTVATDFIISLVCLYALIFLKKVPGKHHLRNLFILFFAFLGTGTLLGGFLGHGFLYLLDPGWRLPGFLSSMVAVAFLAQASLLVLSTQVPRRAWMLLTWLNILLLFSFLVLVIVTQDFLFVIIYVTFSVLFMIAGIQMIILRISGHVAARWFLLAVGTGLAGNVVYIFNLNLSEWFNRSDLGHIFLALSTVLFYRGAGLFLSVKQGIDPAGHTEPESSLKE